MLYDLLAILIGSLVVLLVGFVVHCSLAVCSEEALSWDDTPASRLRMLYAATTAAVGVIGLGWMVGRFLRGLAW